MNGETNGRFAKQTMWMAGGIAGATVTCIIAAWGLVTAHAGQPIHDGAITRNEYEKDHHELRSDIREIRSDIRKILEKLP